MPRNMRWKKWQAPLIREGRLTKWNWMVQNVKGLRLGRYADIGAFTYINAKFGVEVGEGVQVGSHCAIYSVSTIGGKKGRVVLEKNCCIGSHSVILPGVTVGKNSIVGAGAVVTRDIP